jgi:glycosyltransferase involved in cell wall biosynthesis
MNIPRRHNDRHPPRHSALRVEQSTFKADAMAAPTLDVTIVVPYYNPGTSLRVTVEHMVEVLTNSDVTFEIIAVSDGSTDGSELSLEGLPPDLVRRVELDENQGKGQALQVGLSLGRGRYLGFLDADGDISPEFLSSFVSLMQLYQPDIILGSKRHPMSEVQYPWLRLVYSWGYQQLVRVLFHLEVQDTQVGIKLVDRDVMSAVLPLLVERRFAFDLELIVVARHMGYGRLFEAPVRIEQRFRSTISVRAVVGMLVDTLGIFVRLRMLRFYDERRIPPLTMPEPLTDGQGREDRPR